MKIYIKILILCSIFTVGILAGSKVYAMAPSLSFSNYYNGSDSVIMTVVGDSNSLVTFYYPTSSGIQARSLGNTNSAGLFTTTIAVRDYVITSGGMVHVVVNGQQSSSVAWPYYGSSYLSLSQTTVNLSLGQYAYVSAYNTNGSLYVSSNSNPSVATVSINGSTVSIYGQGGGNSTITICQSPSNIFCGTMYVTVGGSYLYPNHPTTGISLSSLTIPAGSNATIAGVSGGMVTISGNTNPSIVSVNTSFGSSVSISGLSIGSTTLTVCQTNTNTCNAFVVIVTAAPLQQLQNQPLSSSCWFTRTLRYGMSGDDVYCLQTYLIREGYLPSGNVNSYFDGETREAVISYQWNHGLNPDGVVGRATRYELFY